MDYRSTKIIAVTTLIVVFFAILSRQAAAGNATVALLDDLRSSNKEVEMAAIEKLGQMKDEKSLNAIIEVLNARQEDWKIRIKAMDVLATSRAPMVTDALMDALADSCPAIKWHATVGLGGFNDDARVVDALIAAMDDSTMYIREAAIESLGRIRARKAVPYIGAALRDSHFAIRLKAVRALKNIDDGQALLFLKSAANNEPDIFIKDEEVSILKAFALHNGAVSR